MAAPYHAHEVRDSKNAQPVPEFPIENWFDSLTGRRLRREYLGSCTGGHLLIGGIPRATGVDLYFRRTQGNPSKPRASEIDADLRRFIERCWHQQLRQTGKPICQRSGNLTWLTTMPLAAYRVDDGPDGGSVLYRFVPVIRRPRGALPVSLANGWSADTLFQSCPRSISPKTSTPQ